MCAGAVCMVCQASDQCLAASCFVGSVMIQTATGKYELFCKGPIGPARPTLMQTGACLPIPGPHSWHRQYAVQIGLFVNFTQICRGAARATDSGTSDQAIL